MAHHIPRLKGPWAAEMTPDQQEEVAKISSGKLIWDFVIKRYFGRINRVNRNLDDYTVQHDSADMSDSEAYQDDGPNDTDDEEPCVGRFLDLPSEIRLNVYAYVLLDHKEECQSRIRPENPPDRYYPKRSAAEIEQARYRAPSKVPPVKFYRRDKSHTDHQLELDEGRRRLLTRVGRRRLNRLARLGRLHDGDEEAFNQYKLQHEMYTRRCWHEDHDGKVQKPEKPDDDAETDSDDSSDDDGEEEDDEDDNDSDADASAQKDAASTVYINARGNLCDDLPMLALSCRLVLCEIWDQIYPHQHPATRCKATIRNLNFLPFFRFCQMLGKSSPEVPKICTATGDLVDIEFDTVFHRKDKILKGNTFQNVKRLIEVHWLHGFPLWGVLTGLSTNVKNPRNPFTDFMYSFRQIVALWRVDHQQWKFNMTNLLAQCRRIGKGVGITASYWRQRSDAEIIEAAIELLTKAAEYKLGYQGSWSPVGRDKSEWHERHMDMFRYRGRHRKTAYQKEHAIVYMVDLYCGEVDVRLRELLRDRYAEWEAVPDKEEIPQDVVL